MSSISYRRLLQARGHVSDEDLLGYLDGELAAKASGRIEEHLKTCWACRARRHRTEQAITEFISFRDGSWKRSPAAPPKGWREFEIRLEQLAGRTPQPPLLHRLGVLWAAARPSPVLLTGACAALACLTLYLWFASAVTPVSANEALARVEETESRPLDRIATPVVHQKVRLRRSSRSFGSAETTLETWSGRPAKPLRDPDQDSLAREFAEVVRANDLSGLPPVSGKTFARWRRSIRVQDERVARTRLGSGAAGLVVETAATGPFRDTQIITGALVLRQDDWHAVGQRWKVHAGGEVREYELDQISSEIVSAPALPPATLPVLPRSLHHPVPPLPAPASGVQPSGSPLAEVPDIEAVEIDARYAIHLRGDCLTGMVQVVRPSAGRILVRGLVDSGRQREELLAALPVSPLLESDIRTLDAAEPAAVTETPRAAETANPAPGGEIAAANLLRQRQLSTEQISRLANRVVEASGAARREAWALRRLAERYGQREAEALPQAPRHKLERMLKDHLLWLGSQLAHSRRLLEPALAGLEAAPEAETAATPLGQRELLSLADSVERMDVLAQELFTVSGLPRNKTDSEMQDLRSVLARLERDSQNAGQRLAFFIPQGGNQ